MEPYVRYALYFILSGLITVLVSYINESGKGGLAAVVASFPVFFLLTAMIAYYSGGPDVAIQYSKGMIYANIGWLAAVLVFAYAIMREWSPAIACTLAISAYLILTTLSNMVV